MSVILKLFWVLCLAVTFFSICVMIPRFYQTDRPLMTFIGIIALLYLGSMLYNAVLVLFARGS